MKLSYEYFFLMKISPPLQSSVFIPNLFSSDCVDFFIIIQHFFVYLSQVVYKKLKGKKSELSDLHGLHPSLAQGLQKLLDFEGNVEVSECLSDSCWKEGREEGMEGRREEGRE